MDAVNERSTRHVTPRPPLECDVYVTSGVAPDGWYEAELLEWTEYPTLGWTAMARYRSSPTDGWIGHFLAKHVRNLNPPD